jgi:hypothetical protein
MNAPIKHPLAAADEFDPWAARVFASWSRVIEGGPIENKPTLLVMMARDASVYADCLRQQVVDDVWEVAQAVGLVRLLGATTVVAAITAAFDGGRS